MGKGDRRSRKGKIWRGTSGKSRPKFKNPTVITKPKKRTVVRPVEKVQEAKEKPIKADVKKAETKKAETKKKSTAKTAEKKTVKKPAARKKPAVEKKDK